jgi:hypothetical protein
MSDATTPGAVNAQIEFIDLAAQRRRIGRRMDEAILSITANISWAPRLPNSRRSLPPTAVPNTC